MAAVTVCQMRFRLRAVASSSWWIGSRAAPGAPASGRCTRSGTVRFPGLDRVNLLNVRPSTGAETFVACGHFQAACG